MVGRSGKATRAFTASHSIFYDYSEICSLECSRPLPTRSVCLLLSSLGIGQRTEGD